MKQNQYSYTTNTTDWKSIILYCIVAGMCLYGLVELVGTAMTLFAKYLEATL